jgi:hypothetical protein
VQQPNEPENQKKIVCHEQCSRTLAKFSMDVFVYESEFDFITLPASYHRFQHYASQENRMF